MRRGVLAACGVGASLLASAAPAFGASKNVELIDNLPEAKHATSINFLQYSRRESPVRDVMLVTGRFGLKSYSLANPRDPQPLDEITAEELRLPGDPPVDFTGDTPPSTFWQNEDMDVDRERKLALLSRDPRAYRGTTGGEAGVPNADGGTNVAGVYVVDAKGPGRPRGAHLPAASDRSHHDVHQTAARRSGRADPRARLASPIPTAR